MEGSVYLKARQEWDERYADLVLGKRNWQITAAGMMAVTLVLAFGMVWVSTRSKFVPYLVEVANQRPSGTSSGKISAQISALSIAAASLLPAAAPSSHESK